MNILSNFKWIIYAVIFSVVAYYGYSHVSSYNEMSKIIETQKEKIDKLDGKIGSLAAENSTKDGVITNLQLAKEVAEAAAERDRIEKEAAEKAFKEINDKRKIEENLVKNNKVTYRKQPKDVKTPPVVDDRALETKLSDIRISSIYDTYCVAVKNENIQFCPSKLPELKS